jgi:Domain of unknown function (DUF4157)
MPTHERGHPGRGAMRADNDHGRQSHANALAPGKRTLVEQLPGSNVVQRKSGGGAGEEARSAAPATGGRELPTDVRAKMEAAMNADFSAVRIHEGPQASAMGALAYTQGTDLYFAPGQYDPQSSRGQELLGHELAHVVQQSQGRVNATVQAHGAGINEDSGLEAEADQMGAKAARGEQVGGGKAPPIHAKGAGQPIQRVKTPGEYKLNSSANLRAKASPYTAIQELPENTIVTVPVDAEELSFRLNILSRDHTYVSYKAPDQPVKRGWVKDSVLQLDTRNERGVGTMHFNDAIAAARGRVDHAVQQNDGPGEARERQSVISLTTVQKPRILRWIPRDIDTSNLYAFVKALNDNILKEVQYTRTYNPPERCVASLQGDCRSICELNKYITETVLGVAGVQIESAKDGVRVAGSDLPKDMYTNHHWIKIGGQRFDAMENRDFDFQTWEVHRNHAWRTMAAGDVIQGISINEF